MTLERLMRELGVNDPTTFKLWLDEERVYLKSLLHEPAEETLQMEYWQRLVNLAGSRYVLIQLSTAKCISTGPVKRLCIVSIMQRRMSHICDISVTCNNYM